MLSRYRNCVVSGALCECTVGYGECGGRTGISFIVGSCPIRRSCDLLHFFGIYDAAAKRVIHLASNFSGDVCAVRIWIYDFVTGISGHDAYD